MKERRARRAKRVYKLNKISSFSFLFLMFFTVHLSMITLSKYTGTVTGVGGSTVAKWEVELDTSGNVSDTINIIAGNGEQSYTLDITSTSETKALYSIILSNIPSDLQVKLDTGSYQTPINNQVTFSNVGYINSNAQTRTITHTLTFNFPINSNVVGSSQIDIDVVFTQENPIST